ncbi:hypothetical protein C2E23DRAFT_737349 [Lenzites betulinus]|nr:hypothetical protein C2E23DRAFT_737349 [Lenzites betulinus]
MKVDVCVSGNNPVQLENFKHVGSYNWVDAPHPTILVPGSPPEWRDCPLPFQVPYDSGLQIFDPAGYHMRSASKLIPLFRAVDIAAEDSADAGMDWPAVDFVLDRSSLRKLWRWARPRSKSKRANDLQDFRLDLQLGGKKTVLVERWDTRTHQYISAPKGGCRKHFDEVTTVPRGDCQSSNNHNRIVQYDLESLRLVVRYEVDACLSDEEDPSDLLARLSLSSSSSPPPPSPPHPSTPLPPSTPPPSSNCLSPTITHSDTTLTVFRGGTSLTQSSLVEIVTRSAKTIHTQKWPETYTQLFLSQTPRLYVALHQAGTFTDVVKLSRADPRLEVYAGDERMRRSLRQLVRVLEDVQRALTAYGPRGRLSLVCRKGRLELFACATEVGRVPDSELVRFGT